MRKKGVVEIIDAWKDLERDFSEAETLDNDASELARRRGEARDVRHGNVRRDVAQEIVADTFASADASGREEGDEAPGGGGEVGGGNVSKLSSASRTS